MSVEHESGVAGLRRFYLQLSIVHPAIDPADITNGLELECRYRHRASAPRMTPKGTPLGGEYPDTRWRHSVLHAVNDQAFADKIEELMVHLESKKAFLKQLTVSGGRLSLIIEFIGDGYFSDEIPRRTLSKIVDLGLNLSIVSYSSQNQ